VLGPELLIELLPGAGTDELDRDIARLSPPKPGGHRAAPVAAAGYAVAPRMPMTTASPPRPEGGYANYVEELRAVRPDLIRMAERGGPPPQLFAGGSYPTSTASGIDAAVVAAIPSWRGRAAAAWEPTLAKAHALVEDYADPEFSEWMARQELDRHPAVQDHVAQVTHWAANSGVGKPYAVDNG